MKSYVLILLSCCGLQASAQNVGIGTSTPNADALVHIELANNVVKGFLVTGTGYTVGAGVPDIGPGARLMFFPGRKAFRAGYISSTQWDNVNVGESSMGMGYNVTASGNMAVAMGNECMASGASSIAIGSACMASGDGAMALGAAAHATNTWANSIGYATTAGGYASNAFGYATTASGDHSTTMGNFVSTSGFSGAFAIGDNSTTTVMQSFVNDGFRARFAGGYRLLTNSAATIGVVLLAGGNAWSAISDVRVKENFIPVDGESFLRKIASMPLTSWNYIGQDVKNFRHYGPMAQDFYKAFGKDDLGTIGCDTLINQQDFLGVNLIAIQALEKRTAQLEDENIALKKQNEKWANAIEKMQAQLNEMAHLKDDNR
jgi:hypothetical protein